METSAILSLDVGARRIGIAIADTLSRLARPLMTVEHSNDIFEQIQQLVAEHKVGVVVVGLPRDMNGRTTQQTRDTLAFVKTLTAQLRVPVHTQDEAVTSKQAEAELKARGKAYAKGDIDALAATIILDDWLHEHQEVTYA